MNRNDSFSALSSLSPDYKYFSPVILKPFSEGTTGFRPAENMSSVKMGWSHSIDKVIPRFSLRELTM
jgi:hypothetical protein